MTFNKKEWSKKYLNRPEIKLKREEYYNKNREKINLQRKKHYQENKVRILKRMKEYVQRPDVKTRIKEYAKKTWIENKEEIKEYKKEHYQKNKIKILAKNRKWERENPERVKKYRQESYKNNPDVRENKKRYQKNNRKKINKRMKEYWKIPNNLLRFRIRSRVHRALTLYTKTGKIMSARKYNINYKSIIKYLKPLPDNLEDYHIHHIKPLFTFDLTIPEQIIEAFKPENHKLLLISDHRKINHYEL